MEGQPIYDISDVAKHNSAADAWIIINGKVLDITSWLAEHPGGEDVLLDLAGQDATREFEDVGHSNEARSRLDSLVIGLLHTSTTPTADGDRGNRASKRRSIGTVAFSQTALYQWINNNLGMFKRVGKFGLLGFASITTIMFLRRYGVRAVSWNRR